MAEPFFRVEMLPAGHGDALLVEYGDARPHRILIDGGPLTAYPALEHRLQALPPGDQALELLVVTHVDTDHIEGIIRLLAPPEPRWPVHIEEIWFNGWRHIDEAKDLGGREGEFMSALIHHRANERWNTIFQHHAVRCGTLPHDTVSLPGGMKLTLLSPDAAALAALARDWKDALTGETWSMDPGDLESAWEKLAEQDRFHPGSELTLGPEDLTAALRKFLKGADSSNANRSSIAFVAEFAGRRCVFLGDAHMRVICRSLGRLGYSPERPLQVDAVKVAHHGSKNNLTPQFLSLVDARHWLFSSNGDKHDHPDRETVEAVIAGAISRPTLWFNYRTPFNTPWEQGARAPNARYRVEYPAEGEQGIVVTL